MWRQRLMREKRWFCTDLGLIDYEEAHDLQLRLVAARIGGVLASDILLLLEHMPVFTLGRRGGRKNLIVSEPFLNEAQIRVVHAERGGDITFHGPGQLVGYPILDLRAAKLTVTDYVERLEEVMIKAAACWGVHATRNPLNHGVWAGERKLGSLGIAIRRGIAFHGFALNVNVSLEPFDWINPCGLQGVKMTSIEREIAFKPQAELTPDNPGTAPDIGPGSAANASGGPGAQIPSMQRIRDQIKSSVEEVFDVCLDLQTPSSCGIPARV
jgi:lipoate-protein ligase B